MNLRLTSLLGIALLSGMGIGGATVDFARAADGDVRARPSFEVSSELSALLQLELSDTPRSEFDWLRDTYAVLRENGWWWAQMRWQGDALELRLGPRAHVDQIEIRGEDQEAGLRFQDAAGLSAGTIIAATSWESRLREGLHQLGEHGYPFASVGLVSLDPDSTTGEVDLVLALFLERRRSVSRVTVEGATHTRPDVLARLSGIRINRFYNERSVDEAESRWQNRGLVEEVIDRTVVPAGEGDAVEVGISVRQRDSFGRAAAALGVVRDANGESRISGEVEVVLLDLFGTAREFQGRWSDDGVQRRRLRLEYLEPVAFGLPFDLRSALGTLHEDNLYDRTDLGVDAEFVGASGRRLEVHTQIERTTFAGQNGRIRWRRRLGATLGWTRSRPVGRGLYGSLVSRVDAAQISEKTRIGEADETVSRSTTQTLVDARTAWGISLSRTMAWEFRVHWRSVEGADLPLPRGEQWTLGGARTVRGYQEEQFHGERAAYGGGEWVLGPSGGGQAYLFGDVGWIRETTQTSSGIRRDENWLVGFGVGLRSPTRAGALDLSIGFAEQVSLDRGKLHLALTQEF